MIKTEGEKTDIISVRRGRIEEGDRKGMRDERYRKMRGRKGIEKRKER